MVVLERQNLEFHFPQLHEAAKGLVSFQRTLRIPDDNREYPLPPGLGKFPLFHLEDYADRVPEVWKTRGGVFFPMYQSEAMWLDFLSLYPCAIKVAAGKINAVTGKPWENTLSDSPQDYMVMSEQPWLDGFCVGEGLIRQFVAMPLGEGFTAEEQITGKAEFGGLQICVYPMKKEFYADLKEREYVENIMDEPQFCRERPHESALGMGLAPGGLMSQEIYEDEYGLEAWDVDAMSRCYIHLVNSEQFCKVTGYAPPDPPPTAKTYTDAGLPWFEYYDSDKKALAGAKPLAQIDSVAARMIKMGRKTFPGNDYVIPKQRIVLGPN